MKEQLVALFLLAAGIIEAAVKNDPAILVAAIDQAGPFLKEACESHLDDFVSAMKVFDALPGFAEFRALVEAAREFGAGQTV